MKSRYQLDRLIGFGGMANVWLGRRRLADGSMQQVAIKRISGDKRLDPDVLERFHREAKICLGFAHENVVRIYDYDLCAGELSIVMEYVEGLTLGQLAERKTLPDEAFRGILGDALMGLMYVHSQGVLHRDISPNNILVTRTGQAKLLDFGLARVLEDPKTGPLFKGTPAYASPEQMRAHPMDFSSDLYSLGATFYHALTGKPPFGDDNALLISTRQDKGAFDPLSDDLSEDLRNIITRLLVPRGARIYLTAGALIDMLMEHECLVMSPDALGAIVQSAMDHHVGDEQVGIDRVDGKPGGGKANEFRADAGSDEGRITIRIGQSLLQAAVQEAAQVAVQEAPPAAGDEWSGTAEETGEPGEPFEAQRGEASDTVEARSGEDGEASDAVEAKRSQGDEPSDAVEAKRCEDSEASEPFEALRSEASDAVEALRSEDGEASDAVEAKPGEGDEPTASQDAADEPGDDAETQNGDHAPEKPARSARHRWGLLAAAAALVALLLLAVSHRVLSSQAGSAARSIATVRVSIETRVVEPAPHDRLVGPSQLAPEPGKRDRSASDQQSSDRAKMPDHKRARHHDASSKTSLIRAARPVARPTPRKPKTPPSPTPAEFSHFGSTPIQQDLVPFE